MPDLKEPDYQSRIRAQIAQYAKPEALLKLPPIYHYWIAKHIRPRMHTVFGVSNVLLIYAGCAAEAFRQPGASRRIISLGAGECVHEISLIKKLLEMGETDFVIEGLELSPVRSERARANGKREGVEQFLEINESDLNSWVPARRYSTVIAKDTLPSRPERIEPRARKRRPKPLTKPRHQMRVIPHRNRYRATDAWRESFRLEVSTALSKKSCAIWCDRCYRLGSTKISPGWSSG